jgi:hypothetical protein
MKEYIKNSFLTADAKATPQKQFCSFAEPHHRVERQFSLNGKRKYSDIHNTTDNPMGLILVSHIPEGLR